MAVIMKGDIAYLDSGAVVSFTTSNYAAFNNTGGSATATDRSEPLLRKLITRLDIAPWGEDNRFPQNISNQLGYCGVALSTLDWKARALFGGGIVHGTITGYDDKGNEIFTPAKPGDFPEIDAFMEENDCLYRFYLEFLQDWVTYGNCFPEYVMSKDGKQIKKLIHQESCDCRFVQMDDSGAIKWVVLSKLWGMNSDQYVKFDPKKVMQTSVVGGSVNATPTIIDNKYVKQRRSLDPYNSFEDLNAAVTEGHTSIIHPIQYPSTNKTYYQLSYWDGVRKAGWIEIAAKVPGMLKVLYEKAFNLKYHIEIPESYMEKRYGAQQWSDFKPDERDAKRLELLASMDKFLSGNENAYKTFVSFFEIGREKGEERGRVKITVIENKSSIDKDLLTAGAANGEILYAMQVNPALPGAGIPGANSGGGAGSGSDIREAWLVYLAQLFLERQIILEPLRVIQRYNKWPKEVKWKIRDVVLTTLDKNSGTEKTIS